MMQEGKRDTTLLSYFLDVEAEENLGLSMPRSSGMSEGDVVAAMGSGFLPATVDSLVEDLHRLGVEPGQTLLVHSSLSQLGYVSGGAMAVVVALERALTEKGTLMMPTHSSGLSDPCDWQQPAVPKEWWDHLKRSFPAYDARRTPTRNMGQIVDCFRSGSGVMRSAHPQQSFAAQGPKAEALTAGHELSQSMGDRSPLARLYDLKGHVLLLGVDHDRNSSLHLAEYRATWPSKRQVPCGAPLLSRSGCAEWTRYDDLDLTADDFTTIAADYLKAGGNHRTGLVGRGRAQLFPQRDIVDFAVAWMQHHRQ